MKKLLPYIVGMVIIVGLAGIFWAVASSQQKNSKTTSATNNSSQSSNVQENQDNQSSTQQDGMKSYSTTEVAVHNKQTDCWTIINKSVYDITSYIPRHPGGEEILRACGVDSTTLFTTRTTADGQEVGSGTPHSNSAERQLSSFKIGVVAQ